MPINGLFILIKLLINKFIYPTPKQFQSNFRTVLINSGNTNIVLCLTRILGISGYTIVICDKNKYCISKYSKYCSAFIKIDDYKDNKKYQNIIKKYNIDYYLDFKNQPFIDVKDNKMKYCNLFEIGTIVKIISELKKIGMNLTNHHQYIQKDIENYYSFTENIYNLCDKKRYFLVKKIILDIWLKNEKYFSANDIKPFIYHSHITPIYNIIYAIDKNIKWKNYDFNNNCVTT